MTEIPGGLHGAYPYENVRSALGDYRLRAAMDKAEFVCFGRGVLLDGDRTLDLRTRAAGALLLAGPEAVLVGSTAAVLHGCTAVGGHPVHVRVPYLRRVRSRDGLVVHQGSVPEADVEVLDGLRALRPVPLLAELLRTASRRGALACADELMRGLPGPDRPDFRAQVGRIVARQPDQRMVRRAQTLLNLATGQPETPMQSAVLLIMADAGLPLPQCQFAVTDAAGRAHRLDFAWSHLRIAVECDADDGWPDRDPARDAHLRRHGWFLLHANALDLYEPATLLDRLKEAFDRRQLAA
ncbi:MAG TPA: hypothetical protein VHZ97_10085 [Pseudonocardiaceae bacterium]|nr:hypothetical protein [Pseudonocardiaceae bacterium]